MRTTLGELLLQSSLIQGGLALALTLAVIALALQGQPIPETLSAALTALLGFYFGAKGVQVGLRTGRPELAQGQTGVGVWIQGGKRMLQLLPANWFVPAMREPVIEFLRGLPIPAEDKKQAYLEWARASGVKIVREDVERATRVEAGEI